MLKKLRRALIKAELKTRSAIYHLTKEEKGGTEIVAILLIIILLIVVVVQEQELIDVCRDYLNYQKFSSTFRNNPVVEHQRM